MLERLLLKNYSTNGTNFYLTILEWAICLNKRNGLECFWKGKNNLVPPYVKNGFFSQSRSLNSAAMVNFDFHPPHLKMPRFTRGALFNMNAHTTNTIKIQSQKWSSNRTFQSTSPYTFLRLHFAPYHIVSLKHDHSRKSIMPCRNPILPICQYFFLSDIS